MRCGVFVCVCEWLSCNMRAIEWTNPCIHCTVCTRCNRISLYVCLLSFCLLMLWCFYVCGVRVYLWLILISFELFVFSSYATERVFLPLLSLYRCIRFPPEFKPTEKYTKKGLTTLQTRKKTSSFFTFILVLSLSSSSSVCNRNTHVTW